MKKIKIEDKIYNREIYFIFDCEFKEYEEYTIKNYGLERESESAPSARFDKIINKDKGYCHYYIWIEKFDWRIYEYALLTHEINHLVFEAMRDIGMEFCKESEEAYTYYMQKITTNILLAIDKHNESEKKKKKNRAKKGKENKPKGNGRNQKNDR